MWKHFKWLGLLPFVAGCASAPAPVVDHAPGASARCDRERDRAAILKLAGEYWVDFHFEETIPLVEGYTPASAYETAGRELVLVVENSPERVVLQHILVVPAGDKNHAIKHWREDWQFEDTELLEFRGRRVWERKQLRREEVSCQWSQAVFEVDDAPRYEATGRWTHERGLSTWASNVTWRPLPRREYTKRSDYEVIVGVNRITVTPEGWAHEQDNEKLKLSAQNAGLVREIGINRYVRSPDKSLAEAAAYWQQTSEYWALVREEWANVTSTPRLELAQEVEGKPLHERLIELSKERMGDAVRARIRETIQAYLVRKPIGEAQGNTQVSSR